MGLQIRGSERVLSRGRNEGTARHKNTWKHTPGRGKSRAKTLRQHSAGQIQKVPRRLTAGVEGRGR